jgi:hypothetical protein
MSTWAPPATATNCESAAIRLRNDEIKRFVDPVSGIRFYPCPSPDGKSLIAYPGATSLLGFVAPQKDKDVLTRWREREIAAGRTGYEGAERGTLTHACCERWVLGLDPSPDNLEIAEFYEGMTEPLEDFSSFMWSERPLRADWLHAYNTDDVNHPDRLARVYSHSLGCSGTPDLIGMRNGKVVLVDFKTSGKRLYVQPKPGDKLSRDELLGFKAFVKTCRQMIAYSYCIKETLNVDVEEMMIIVGLRDQTQVLHVEPWRIEQERYTTLALAQEFWRKFAELRADQLRLVAA